VGSSASIEATLAELLAADQRVRELSSSLVAAHGADGRLLEALRSAVKAAGERDTEQASGQLVRLALLLGELEVPAAVDCLIDVLACRHADARSEAGEQLLELAVDRFPLVHEAVERAIVRLPSGSAALSELPFVLAEIPEPAAFDLLTKLLQHEDPNAVAAAIEVVAGLGDPASAALLRPLLEDHRSCSLCDEDEPEMEMVTLGELAADALELLASEPARGGRSAT